MLFDIVANLLPVNLINFSSLAKLDNWFKILPVYQRYPGTLVVTRATFFLFLQLSNE